MLGELAKGEAEVLLGELVERLVAEDLLEYALDPLLVLLRDGGVPV